MDLSIANTVISLLMVAIGWIGKQFWEGFKEARGRRKSEVQRLTEDRDKAWRKARTIYNRKQVVWDVLWETRRVAREHGIPDDELPDPPPREPF